MEHKGREGGREGERKGGSGLVFAKAAAAAKPETDKRNLAGT